MGASRMWQSQPARRRRGRVLDQGPKHEASGETYCRRSSAWSRSSRRCAVIPRGRGVVAAEAGGDSVTTVLRNPGMRRGEILGLAWERVDFSRGALKEIQELLGHRDFKMTLRYAHLSLGRLCDAIASSRTSAQNQHKAG